MKILSGILALTFATGVFAGGDLPPIETMEVEVVKDTNAWVGLGFSDFNTYQVGTFSIENDDFNEHSQGLSVMAGYNFYDTGTWILGGEARLGRSNWNLPLDTTTGDLLARATYQMGYVGLYALGGISVVDYSNWNIDNVGPALGLGITGMVTDNASVFFDYIGKPMDMWHDYSEDYVDSGVATVGITYSF